MTSSRSLIAAIGLVFAAGSYAQDTTEPAPCHALDCVVAKRGTATVTVADIKAKIGTVDKQKQDTLLSDSKQLTAMIENMLILRQIANEADAAKAAADVVLQARIRQVNDEVMAVYQLDHIRDTRLTSSFENLAREHYLANKDKMRTPQEAIVRHLLIDAKTRGDVLARAEIDVIAKQAAGASTEKFIDIAMDKSEDPSKTGNAGIIQVVEGSTEIAPAFLDAALKLTTPGEISPPVRTEYGYHLIQLLEGKPGKLLTFEEARPGIIAKLQQDARRRVVGEYRAELMATGKLEVYPKNLEGVVYGEDAPAAQ